MDGIAVDCPHVTDVPRAGCWKSAERVFICIAFIISLISLLFFTPFHQQIAATVVVDDGAVCVCVCVYQLKTTESSADGEQNKTKLD